MYAVAKIDLSTLDEAKHQAYLNLIVPEHHHLFNSQKTSEILVIGAELNGKPIGILLAELILPIKTAEVVNLFVSEEHRNHGIGTQLLTELQDILTEKKYVLILFPYSTAEASATVLEDILKKMRWPPSRLLVIRCKFDGFTFNPPWLHAKKELPQGFSIFPWEELTHAEKQKVKSMEKSRVFPYDLSPFREEPYPVEMLNSLGLHHNGEVVGWMITHRISTDTIRYSAFFILRQWQMQGIAVQMLRESIKLQIQSPVQWGILDVNVGQTEKSWLQFLQKRLMPYATEVSYIRQAWKQLDRG